MMPAVTMQLIPGRPARREEGDGSRGGTGGCAAGRTLGVPVCVFFPKDRFAIDLDAKTVTCPAGVTVPIRARTGGRHAGTAASGARHRTA